MTNYKEAKAACVKASRVYTEAMKDLRAIKRSPGSFFATSLLLAQDKVKTSRKAYNEARKAVASLKTTTPPPPNA